MKMVYHQRLILQMHLRLDCQVLLSLTVIVRYVFSSIFTGFFVYEYSTKNWFDNCKLSLSQSPTIPSNNDENLPPAISSVTLQKLSPSVAMLSSPSNAAAYTISFGVNVNSSNQIVSLNR